MPSISKYSRIPITKHRVQTIPGCDVNHGSVIWSPWKSLWFTGMFIAGFGLGMVNFNWAAFGLFIVSTGIVLLLGHSLGMHRRLIHGSFQCPRWLDYLLVYVGTLVGISGPLGLLRTHDMRDYAQRQPKCHDYYAHRQDAATDFFWQIHCDLILKYPPRIDIEQSTANNHFYQFLEQTWMLQQLPWGLLFYWLGDWAYVYWGVCARISISIFGHWLIGYFAHRHGPMHFEVKGACVQGHNVRFCALLTMGESWHNNHHAFPGSAKLGLAPGEWDPGWWLLKCLEYIGLVWNLKLPQDLPHRPELHTIPRLTSRTTQP